MDSRLPKPTCLKRPGAVNKNILPMDRIKSNQSISTRLQNINYVPLSKDISNFPSFETRRGRAPSPTFGGNSKDKPKLRRSRSACDIRLQTRAGFTASLPPSMENSTLKLHNPMNTTKPPNMRSKILRSESANDMALSRSTKRHDPTLAPIPSKMARFQSSHTITTRRDVNNTARIMKAPLNANVKKLANDSTISTVLGASKPTGKRIPAYDFKARYNDLLEKHKALREKYDTLREELCNLENLPQQFEESQAQLIAIKEELKNAQIEIECLEQLKNSQNLMISSITKSLESTKEEFETLKEKYDTLVTDHTKISDEVVGLRSSNSLLSTNNDAMMSELVACKEQLFRANMERKDLHNAVMDLRGNIRVFCRVRPPLEDEKEKPMCGWNYLDEASLEIHNHDHVPPGGKSKVISHSYSFDHVFHPRSTQEDVFEMVSPLIQSALDGYNICIFAYGQTGSGKTYTMDGIQSSVGVIPRTVDLLFDAVENYKRLGWLYQIKVSFLEIYNEVLYDLLSNEQKEMEIRLIKNSKTDIYVTNLTEEVVSSADRLRQLMQIARMNRATASTVGNDRSSRSHAVTKIELVGNHVEKGEISIGTVNLVDLAGSESPKTSIRMNETKSINKSLSELTNVILALQQKNDHIPYRNSKLTHLLMPSLGGNSKTLMFINVAPFQECFPESVKSLRFAASVNSCKMTKVKKNKFLNTSATTG